MPVQPGPPRGRLIALEGLDGVGKTTQAGLLAANLARLGLSVVLTREPTDGLFGQKIRQLLRHGRKDLSPAAELELFIADRREHIQKVIEPGLAQGAIVITDRYYFSSMAYQGALGLDPLDIMQRHEGFAPKPDLVIILELPLAEIAHRLAKRGAPRSRSFENLDYLAKVAALFDRLQEPFIARIEGDGLEAEVQARILAVVSRVCRLPELKGCFSQPPSGRV